MSNDEGGRPIWASWRITDAGRVQVVLTREGEGEGEYRRERREFESLEAAAGELGESFREVVQSVMAEGRRQGRWRR